MKINLADIPEEGKDFLFTHTNHHIASALKDVLKESQFITDFNIRPINSRDFEMRGTFKTVAPETCSRCGLDIELPIDEKFHEILIPKQPVDRQGKYAKKNHISDVEDDGTSTLEYEINMTMNITDYLHEVVALALPFIPAPAEDSEGNCVTCKVKVRGKLFKYEEEMPEEKPESPFKALKNLKLN